MSGVRTDTEVAGRAFARVGLLGNPSDGYGGRVIAMTLPEMSTDVQVATSDRWQLVGSDGSRVESATLAAFPRLTDLHDGAELMMAVLMGLQQFRPDLVDAPARLSFTTTIPRQVGLAGSSAIIIATMRALAARAGIEWNRVELARTALEVETDLLGWAAGPQDRVVQAYEGLVDMDFAEPWQADRYHQLDPGSLPSLYVAWDTRTGERSDVVHADVRSRWIDGDPEVRSVIKRFAELAIEGRASFDAGTSSEVWPRLMDEAFDLRSQIWTITPIDTALVEAGRSCGAGVAFAGSGGAVVGSVRDPSVMPELARAYGELGAGFRIVNP